MNRNTSSKRQIIDEEQTNQLNELIANKLTHYLSYNDKRAFTETALLRRIENSFKSASFKKYFKKNGKQILENLFSDEIIRKTYKDRESLYTIL